MKRVRVGYVILAAVLSLALGQKQALGFRCGVSLISEGDSKSRVLAKCGEPFNIEYWQEERIKRDFYRPSYPGPDYPEHYREPFLVKELIRIEEWTYNLGRTQFIRYVRFENGRVRKIYTGDYGF